MRHILSIITVVCLIIGLTSCAKTEETIKIGTVKVIAGGSEYIPMQNFIFSQRRDGIVADGARKRPREVEGELPVSPYHENLQILIDGEITGEPSYTLYGNDNEEVYYGQPIFTLPDRPGNYIVSVEVVWGDEEAFEGYQYLFAISWPESSGDINEISASYPEQAKEDLQQCMDGSVRIFINRAKDEGRKASPGINYSDARMSPNGNYILCKTDAGGAGEARWSGYCVIDLTTNPTEVYTFDGEQWGFQNHVFLSDELIGIATGAVIGGQEDTWKSIQVFDAQYNPLNAAPQFLESEDTHVVGIGYYTASKQYVLAYAKDTAKDQMNRFSENRFVLALFESDGTFLSEYEIPEEYMSPYSPNLLTLYPNNPVVTSEGHILIPVVKREDIKTGNYHRKKLLVINPADWSVQELPCGEALRLSAEGDRAFAVSYDDDGIPFPVILDFNGRAEAAVTGFPDTLWEVAGYPNRFYPFDAVMRAHHVYVMAESYTENGDAFCGLFYWDGEQAELLRVFPGSSFCSLAGVSGEGSCYVMLHGMVGDEYDDRRDYAKTLIGSAMASVSNALSVKVTVTFPASDDGKTESNASVYEIDPFDMSLELPSGWKLKEWEQNQGYDFITVFSKLLIYNENDECVGVIGYNAYELYEGAEDDTRAIYGQIALGNNYQFDVRNSYDIVNETGSVTTAVVDVYYSASINNGVEKTNKGIVSHNRDFLVYIAAEFDNDMVTDEQVVSIAKSIQISR